MPHKTVWQRMANNRTSQLLQDTGSKLKRTSGARSHRAPLVSTAANSVGDRRSFAVTASPRARGILAPPLGESLVWNIWNGKPGQTDSATGRRPALVPWTRAEGSWRGGLLARGPACGGGRSPQPPADPLGAGSAPPGRTSKAQTGRPYGEPSHL